MTFYLTVNLMDFAQNLALTELTLFIYLLQLQIVYNIVKRIELHIITISVHEILMRSFSRSIPPVLNSLALQLLKDARHLLVNNWVELRLLAEGIALSKGLKCMLLKSLPRIKFKVILRGYLKGLCCFLNELKRLLLALSKLIMQDKTFIL